MTLKPWREIAVPHEDVLKGTFQQAEFADDNSCADTFCVNVDCRME